MAPDAHQSLVEEARRGDAVAIDTLLERHLPGLLAYVRLHSRPAISRKEASADLVQSVCLDLLEHPDGFEYRGEGAFRQWLYAKALGKICDRQRYYRAAKRDHRREDTAARPGAPTDLAALLPSFTSPSQIAIRNEEMQRIETAFAKLSDDYQEVIRLARIVGLPYPEIAQQMGRSEGAVRVLLHRALARLGFLLSDPDVFGTSE